MNTVSMHSPIRQLLLWNPMAPELVAARGLASYGSATGASNDAGVMAFGWNMLHLLSTPEERLALLHNDCQRSGLAYISTGQRSAAPTDGMVPIGEVTPTDWPWPTKVAGDHQHFWGVIWAATALFAERERLGGKMKLEWPGALGGLDAESIWKLRLSAHANALAGVARMPYLLGPGSWRGPDGLPRVNPDPSARGYAGPILAGLIAARAEVPMVGDDSEVLLKLLDVSLDAYADMGASYFNKAQTPDVVRPYFIPAQEAQLVVAWEAVRAEFARKRVHPVRELRLSVAIQQLCEMLVPFVGSCADGATPWVVSMNEAGPIPKVGAITRETHTPHRATFDPSAWMIAMLRIAINRGIPKAMQKYVNMASVTAGPKSEQAWAAKPIWEEL